MKNKRTEGTYHKTKKVTTDNDEIGLNEVDKKRLRKILGPHSCVFDNEFLAAAYKDNFEK